MTRKMIACALIASATFVAVAADLRAEFIIAAPDRTPVVAVAMPSSLDATIVPIEDLQGPGPASCVLEVCESNVDTRPTH